jgi:hypothetical protein
MKDRTTAHRHWRYCRICRRKLTTSRSRIRGMGPTCARRNRFLEVQTEYERAGQMRLPGIM